MKSKEGEDCRKWFEKYFNEAVDNDGKVLDLFRFWPGNKYVFLFKKDCSVTNIQYRELISLIKADLKNNKANLTCLTRKRFIENVESISDNLKNGGKLNDYGNYFEKTIVVDAYTNSCIVFIPPNMEIDLEKICFLSGYIHSCGECVYFSKFEKSDRDEFMRELCIFGEKIGNKSGNVETIRLIPLWHEMDNETEKSTEDSYKSFEKSFFSTSELTKDISEMKLYNEKSYLRYEPLYEVLDCVNNSRVFRIDNIWKFANNKDLVIMPEMGESDRLYLVKSKIEGNDSPLGECCQYYVSNGDEDNQSETLWLLSDRNIIKNTDTAYSDGSSDYQKGDSRFYICFHAQFINKSPFYIFEEDKPAWKEQETLPHSLTASMLNIALENGIPNNLVISDPFVGTGTTFFETLKYMALDNKKEIVFIGNDLERYASQLIEDNKGIFEIISLSQEGNQALIDSVLKYKPSGTATLWKLINDNDEMYLSKDNELDRFKILVEKLVVEIGKNRDEWSLVTGKNEELEKRLIAYCVIKAYRRNKTSMKDGTEILCMEQRKLHKLLSLLKVLYKERQNSNKPNDRGLSFLKKGYSFCCIDGSAFLETCYVGKEDARDFLKEKKDSIDVVITDPPYGYNVEKFADGSENKLSELYNEMSGHLIEDLKDNGVIVMCLPSKSRVGKAINPFCLKRFYIPRLYEAASSKEVYIQHDFGYNILPCDLFGIPFYWNSHKALRRDMIYYRINKAQSGKEPGDAKKQK